MKSVSVSELKARLSHYLQWVKRGGEVQVLERGVPVAQLTGVRRPGEDDGHRERLMRSGVLRAGSGDASWILSEERISLRGPSLSEALAEEREDRL